MDPLPQINDVVDETNRIDSPTISNLVHGSKSQSSYPPTTQSNDYISSDSSSASTSNPTSLQATPEEDFSFSTSSPKQVLQENPSDLVFEETQNVSRRPPAVDEPAVKKNTSNSNPFRDVAKVLFSNSPQQERSISSLTSTATSGTSKPQPSSASAKPPSSFFTSSTSSTSNSNAQQAGGAKMRASTVLPAPNSSSKSVNATLPLPRQSNLSNKNRPLNISSPQPTTVGAGTGAGQRKLGEAPHAPLPPLYKVPKQVTFFDNASGGAGVSGRAGGGGGGSVGGRAGSGGAGIGIAGSKRDVGGSLLGRTASSASACSANATAATPQIRPLAAGAGVGVGVGGGAAASNNKQNATGTTSTSRAASQQASFLSSRTQPSTTQQSSQPARSVTPNPKQHPAGASVGSGTRTGAASSCNHSNNSSGRGLPFFADAAKPTEEAGNVTPQTRFEETGDSGRGSDDGDAAAVEAVTPQSGGAVGGSTEWPAIIAQQQQQRQQQQPFGVGASGRQAAMQCAEADAQMAGLAERLQQAQLSLKEVKRMVVAQTVATAVAESK